MEQAMSICFLTEARLPFPMSPQTLGSTMTTRKRRTEGRVLYLRAWRRHTKSSSNAAIGTHACTSRREPLTCTAKTPGDGYNDHLHSISSKGRRRLWTFSSPQPECFQRRSPFFTTLLPTEFPVADSYEALLPAAPVLRFVPRARRRTSIY